MQVYTGFKLLAAGRGAKKMILLLSVFQSRVTRTDRLVARFSATRVQCSKREARGRTWTVREEQVYFTPLPRRVSRSRSCICGLVARDLRPTRSANRLLCRLLTCDPRFAPPRNSIGICCVGYLCPKCQRFDH